MLLNFLLRLFESGTTAEDEQIPLPEIANWDFVHIHEGPVHFQEETFAEEAAVDYDSDATVGEKNEGADAGTKKRKLKTQLAAARDAKKRIRIVGDELQTQFYAGKIPPAVAEDTDADDADAAESGPQKAFRYRVAMERLDEGYPWYLKSVACCAKISEKTLRDYHKVWKQLDSDQSVKSKREEIFDYFVMHKKPGPQMADPMAMWKISQRADLLIDNGQGQKCATIRTMFKNVALPEMQAVREQSGKNVMAGAASLFKRSFSSMRRLIQTITPFVRKGMSKLSQDRLKANKNPAGGMSLVAGLQHILKGIHKHNIICFDSLTTYVNENVPKQVYLTEKKKGQLESKRRGVKATTGNAQRRSLKINLGIKRGSKALISCTAIVSDTEFSSLKHFAITPEYDIIFCPHSPDDEKVQHEFENVDSESLKYRQSKMLYDVCVIPKCLAHGQAMMDFAKNTLQLPHAEVQRMGTVLLFQDGKVESYIIL